MQLMINFFSQHAADTVDPGQLIDAGSLQPAQSTEAGQQLLAAFHADSRNILQR